MKTIIVKRKDLKEEFKDLPIEELKVKYFNINPEWLKESHKLKFIDNNGDIEILSMKIIG